MKDVKIKYILAVLALTVFTNSCSRLSPAGFWTEFHSDLITAKYSDQGPWGGHRKISWKSETGNFFTPQKVIDFAEKNGWKLVDSISFSADTLTKNSVIVFKNDGYSTDIFRHEVLPELTAKDNKVLVFETDWLEVEPGNARETFEDGFAVLNSGMTELKVFHLWGD
jgi:hypothetical protein